MSMASRYGVAQCIQCHYDNLHKERGIKETFGDSYKRWKKHRISVHKHEPKRY